MLVLSRREMEEIVIGRVGDVLTAPIRIAVVKFVGDKVRLGVTAQRDLVVLRSELPDRYEVAEQTL